MPNRGGQTAAPLDLKFLFALEILELFNGQVKCGSNRNILRMEYMHFVTVLLLLLWYSLSSFCDTSSFFIALIS